MEKIMIVGDVHGEWDKLNDLINHKKPDIILQCGDFGWWPNLECKAKTLYGGLKQKSWKLEGIKANNTKIYWCDGNHEDHYALERFTPDKPRYSILLYKGVYYMPRGSVFKLPDGRNVMFIGGADSIDKNHRTLGIDWFEEELINYEQQNHILDYDEKVDIIISHTCPLEWEPRECLFGKEQDPTRKILSAVLEKFKPDMWIHGHWHIEKSGKHNNTYWESLSCPGSQGRWWKWLK
jgi:Icc-related predicted phosphoesterase